MTPEDDVKKDIDQDSTDNDEADEAGLAEQAEQAQDAQKPSGGETAKSEKTATDYADKAADALRDLNSSNEDIDVAANTQDEGEDEDTGEQVATDDVPANDKDPLDFLDKNADGSVENPDDEVAGLRTQLDDAKDQILAHKEQLLRMQAEMENQRKRAQNDVTKAHKFALEKIALDLLPVKDSLEMGLEAATAEDAEPSKIIEGSELTLKMLAQALEKYNIVEINPIDEKFDPEFHQAMTMQPVEGKEPNTVAGVMQKGYTLNERLIRPALVMVAK